MPGGNLEASCLEVFPSQTLEALGIYQRCWNHISHFASSEFEITDYEQDNSAALPDNIGLAILMNKIGKLQRQLQLTATTEYSTT